MKSRFFILPGLALVAGSIASSADGSWTGWISDDMCGAKNAGQAGAECASRCVKEHGAKYVFVNDSDKRSTPLTRRTRSRPTQATTSS